QKPKGTSLYPSRTHLSAKDIGMAPLAPLARYRDGPFGFSSQDAGHSFRNWQPRLTFLRVISLLLPRPPVSAFVGSLLLPLAILEILLQTTKGQTAGRRPLPGGSAGAQFEHQAAQHFFARGRPGILPEIGDFTQGGHIKSTESLFLHVIMETAVNLIVPAPVYHLVALRLGDSEEPGKAQTNLLRRYLFHG